MPNILLVCTANICRSPMAMALLERKLRMKNVPGRWTVSSAGTWARSGLPASEHGRNLMAEWGLDLSEHRSRIVNREMLASADLILTMEQGHKEALQSEFQDLTGRLYMLSEMVGLQSDIRDPYGEAASQYRETAMEIDDLLEKGLDRILSLAAASTTV